MGGQLITDTENLSKNATPLDQWLATRDATFRKRHAIPNMPSYDFLQFGEFVDARKKMLAETLRELTPPTATIGA